MMEQLYPTTHNSAAPADFAKTVLMPGDPLRAQKIAKEYLTDAKLVNNVRGVQGYTGAWHGKRVSVMASGMGMPSIGIYSHELFNLFGVERIIRIGSIGAVNRNLNLGDIVIAQAASTNSNYLRQYGLGGYNYSPISDFKTTNTLNEEANKIIGKRNKVYVGNILSSDTFYAYSAPDWNTVGILGIEMESAALFAEATVAGKQAACICTVSDLTFDISKQMTAEERQNNLNTMIKTALNTVFKMDR